MNAPDTIADFLFRGGAEICRSQPRILFVASPSWLPAVRTGGSPMIAHAVTRGFLDRGWSVGFLGQFKPHRWPGTEEASKQINAAADGARCRFWYSLRTLTPSDARAVAAAIGEMDPDIIYCYGTEAALSARLARPRGRIVVTFYDTPTLPGVYKRLALFKYGDLRTKLRVLRGLPVTLRTWFRNRNSALPGLAAADIVICHSYNHGREYARRLGRPVDYFPNPLEVVPPIAHKRALHPPAFIMVGNVTSTVSQTGLYFFCSRVLPHIAGNLARSEFQIRIIGGGQLPAEISSALARHANVSVLGEVSEAQLHEEYARATALLVPTPIPIGFRTRIMDAFRYGVPTIAHTANKAGFYELEHDRNCLMTDDGATFARFMGEAVRYHARMAAIVDTARREFETQYSADVFCDFVIARVRGEVLKSDRQQ